MNRRYRRKRKQYKTKNMILTHIENNIKNYAIVSIIFFIGIVMGVIFINNTSEIQYNEITSYINTFIKDLKENQNIDNFLLLKDSIKKNLILTIFLWFMGSTIIGVYIVYATICFRGFCLGYTISSIILSLGFGKGIIFLLSALLLQNLIFVPCILALAVSGMGLHNLILEYKKRENIKLGILKHTLFSIFVLSVLIISSLIEVYISKDILLLLIKYL